MLKGVVNNRYILHLKRRGIRYFYALKEFISGIPEKHMLMQMTVQPIQTTCLVRISDETRNKVSPSRR